MTTHVPPRFREDNTEGYSLADLSELNRRFDGVVADNADYWTGEGEPYRDELAFKSWLDQVAERVLAEFDVDRAGWAKLTRRRIGTRNA